MTNRRNFSLLSLLVLIAFVAILLAFFLARRELAFQNARYDQLHQKYAQLFETTGQIEATDPDLIYVRQLESDAPFVFRYRIAIPKESTVRIALEHSEKGKVKELQANKIKPVEANASETHLQHELTIRLGTLPRRWSANIETSGPNGSYTTTGIVLNASDMDWLSRYYGDDRGPFNSDGPNRTELSPVTTFPKNKRATIQQIAETDPFGATPNHFLRFVLFVEPPDQLDQ